MTRTLFISLFITIIFSSAFSQKTDEKDVPAGIVATFIARFPDIQNRQWEKLPEFFCASFEQDGMPAKSYFKDNIWIRTEWDIPVKYVPDTINQYLKKNYPKFKTYRLMLQNSSNDPCYFVFIQKKNEKQMLQFSTLGEFKSVTDKF